MADQTLKDRIADAMKAAMRARDKQRLAAIRLIQADIKRIEVDERTEVDDERVLSILDKMCKQRRDAARQYRDAGRDELAGQEDFEIGIIQSFMPQQLTDDEIDRLIDEAIAESGAASVKDIGKVMGVLKPKLQGRADMGAASKAVKAKLQ